MWPFKKKVAKLEPGKCCSNPSIITGRKLTIDDLKDDLSFEGYYFKPAWGIAFSVPYQAVDIEIYDHKEVCKKYIGTVINIYHLKACENCRTCLSEYKDLMTEISRKIYAYNREIYKQNLLKEICGE